MNLVATADPSGEGIAVSALDASGASIPFTHVGGQSDPTLSIDGKPYPLAWRKWGSVPNQGGLTFAYLPTFAEDGVPKLTPSSTLELHWADDNFATTAGPVPAGSVAVANHVGRRYTHGIDLVSPRKMPVGINFEQATIGEHSPRFTNRAKRSQPPFGATWDADGNPLTSDGPAVEIAVAEYWERPSLVPGPYTLVFDGKLSDAGPVGFRVKAVERKELRVDGPGGVGNVRVWDIGPEDGAPGWSITLGVSSRTPDPSDPTGKAYLHDFKNWRLYGPDPSDPTFRTPRINIVDPPEFDEECTGRLEGYHSVRFMGSHSINDRANTEYSDITPRSRAGYYGPVRELVVPVESARPYDDPDPPYDPSGKAIVEFRSPGHGLTSGQLITYIGDATFTLSAGPDLPAANAGSDVWVTGPDTFLLTVQGSGGRKVTNTIHGGEVRAYNGIGGGVPWDSAINLCNSVASIKQMDVNIHLCDTDDCVREKARRIAVGLKRDAKVEVEYVNEPWNGSFWARAALSTRAHALGLYAGYDGWQAPYTIRADQIRAIFEAELVAAGRPASDVIMSYGVWGYANVSTAQICDYAHAHGIRIPRVKVSPYFDVDVPAMQDPATADLNARLTPGQTRDILARCLVHCDSGGSAVRPQREVLDDPKYHGWFRDTEVVGYEGGITRGFCLPQPPGRSDLADFSWSVVLDPAYFDIELLRLHLLESAGLAHLDDFYFAGADGYLAAPDHIRMWSLYRRQGQPIGTGSPHDPPGASQRAGAHRFWNSLVTSQEEPTVTVQDLYSADASAKESAAAANKAAADSHDALVGSLRGEGLVIVTNADGTAAAIQAADDGSIASQPCKLGSKVDAAALPPK